MATKDQEKEVVGWMSLLNKAAAELMLKHRPSACTDITGFGLIGHACEMALGAGVTISLQLAAIPLMGGVAERIADGMVPAGCYQNRSFYLSRVDSGSADTDRLLPLFDPQTSGGLLIAFAADDAKQYVIEAHVLGVFAQLVGEVKPRTQQPVTVV